MKFCYFLFCHTDIPNLVFIDTEKTTAAATATVATATTSIDATTAGTTQPGNFSPSVLQIQYYLNVKETFNEGVILY